MKAGMTARLERARVKGTRSGNPIGRPRVVFDRAEVARLRRQGLSWSQIASRLGVSTGTVRRAYQAAGESMVPCQNPVATIISGTLPRSALLGGQRARAG